MSNKWVEVEAKTIDDAIKAGLKELELDDVLKKKTKLNSIGFPLNDPYGLSEAWWKIFTKPKVE